MKDQRGLAEIFLLVGAVVIVVVIAFFYTSRAAYTTPESSNENQPTPTSNSISPTISPTPTVDTFPTVEPTAFPTIAQSLDFHDCFQANDDSEGLFIQPTLSEIAQRCPIFLFSSLRTASVNNIFETEDTVTIYQSGVVYVLYKQKPNFPDENLGNSILRKTITEDSIIVTSDSGAFPNNVVDIASCTTPDQSSCTPLEKGILVNLYGVNVFWLEIFGSTVNDYFENNEINSIIMTLSRI
ncbi:hypothetical protein KC571_00725 [candidate division WWE3 bacterium]|uniref:Uncharacterized protein n=1 Tax=candidate division WWE3 bacterium TaxID=2053526 RepID=A0A955RP00_UNCKA|nr:hypothetical protein [candidate division WWE3 bacterium]